jgi:preprotein translocase subunit SecF
MIFKYNYDKVYNVMGLSKATFFISIALLLVAAFSFGTKGINYGLDFTGGTLIEVAYENPADLEAIRDALAAGGYQGAVVQHFGSEHDVMIRMQRAGSSQLGDEVLAVLQKHDAKVVLSRIEFVGPQVGDELKSQGVLAVVLSLIAVAFYLAFRFQSKFALAAILSLIHDVVITVACFSFFGWEFDLIVLAAVLAIIGYSLNDTIVVFDRIRENITHLRQVSMTEIINISVSETMSRTLMTAVTMLITLFVLLFTGGETLWGFSMAMIIGVTFGTYSSIYVASSLLDVLKVTREDMIPPDRKEGEEYDTP